MANVYWILSRVDLLDVVDILLVAAVIYAVLLLVRGTQAVQLLRGVILLALFIALIGSLAGLTAFNWLMRSSGQFLAVVIAIVLQPELRRALERLGRAGGVALWSGRDVELDRVVNALVSACRRLSERRHGALIVLERDTGLQDYVDTGVEIDALVADELLQTIFFPSTALHDGAAIVRGTVWWRPSPAALAGPSSPTYLGTRHRAAVGITEQTDAIASSCRRNRHLHGPQRLDGAAPGRATAGHAVAGHAGASSEYHEQARSLLQRRARSCATRKGLRRIRIVLTFLRGRLWIPGTAVLALVLSVVVGERHLPERRAQPGCLSPVIPSR